MGTGARTTWRRTLDIVGTALCVGTLVGTFLVVLAASASVDVRQAAVSSVAMLEPGTTSETGLRDLPILLPGGPVERSFPGGVGLDDPARVAPGRPAPLANSRARDWIGTLLWFAARADRRRSTSSTCTTATPTPTTTWTTLVDYLRLRRRHPCAPGQSGRAGQPAAAQRRRGRRATTTPTTPTRTQPSPTACCAAPATSVDTCDVQLELTFTVAMGFAPHIARRRAGGRRGSRGLCPETPPRCGCSASSQIVAGDARADRSSPTRRGHAGWRRTRTRRSRRCGASSPPARSAGRAPPTCDSSRPTRATLSGCSASRTGSDAARRSRFYEAGPRPLRRPGAAGRATAGHSPASVATTRPSRPRPGPRALPGRPRLPRPARAGAAARGPPRRRRRPARSRC